AIAARRDRRWAKEPYEAAGTPVREIAGATLGLVGYGGIGRELAARAVALGMRVIALKRTPAPAPPGVELRTGSDGLREVLGASDYLVLALPETAESRGLIVAAELAMMRRGAVLINLAR